MTISTPTPFRARALTEQAIAAALDADWARAVELNTKIVEALPDDVEARNRLGRALLEQGKLDEARTAYAEVLKMSPNDPIALRNVGRIQALVDGKAKPNATRSKTQPRLFIEDMGKTGILRLMNPAPPHIVARYSPGAEAELREQEGLLAVHARDGELLGFLEPKVGRRLIDLMRTGNEYVIALISNDQQNPRVAIRETFQSAQNANRISFPGHHRPAETKERAYIKGNFFRIGRDEDSDEDVESEDVLETTSAADAEEDPAAADEPIALEEDDDDDEDEAEE